MNPGAPPPPSGYGYPPGVAPAYPGYYPPPPGKNTTPRTLGTLSIVFGAIVAALSLFSLLAGNSFGAFMDSSRISKAAFDRYLADIHSASMTLSALMLLMSVVLIYIGVGQRRYQRWAVRASVWWGIAALLVLGVQLVVNLAVVLPAAERLIADMPSRLRSSMGMMMKVGMFTGLIFYAPYPIILISSFRKREVVDVMDQPPLPTAEVHRG